MTRDSRTPTHTAWANFRFSVVGPLLSAPPARGELKAAIDELSEKTWKHPVTGKPARFASSTIERWYYQARCARQDPIGVLRRQVRKDAGTHRVLSERLIQGLIAQYKQSKHWSVKLHHDNLVVLVEEDQSLGPMPSYSSVLRFMRSRGFDKRPRRRDRNRPGVALAEARLDTREVRSYEVEYVNALWHLDFHTSSLKVLTSQGEWVYPKLLGVLDDYSRLACHVQWYLGETTDDLVHGVVQAICKRGVPAVLLTDNGSAMTSEEFRQGWPRLGTTHETTLPYSPYQNAKQEVFWATVEGRVMSMLDGVGELTLDFLNQATQAWAEMEYNRTRHSETNQKPLDRFIEGRRVGYESPSSQALHDAFRQDVKRIQRRSDGTLSIDGVRFELPARFRHLRQVVVRYARWNLRNVHLIDPRTEALLAPIYPLDKAKNADGRRRTIQQPGPPTEWTPISGDKEEVAPVAPLLRKLMAQYAATGLPPAYLPKPTDEVSP